MAPSSPPEPPIDRLLRIMAELRDPDSGCDWDRAQTFSSLVPYTLEEAYEVADAVEQGAPGDLKDELGDLLLQVVFYARIAEEDGLFAFADIARAIGDKMVRRHPHIFAKAEMSSSASWEALKRQERASKAVTGVLGGVAASLPALTRAVKLSSRAAAVGFAWSSTQDVLDKVSEELEELQVEIGCGDAIRAEEELGDLLFVLANLGRAIDIDPERALRGANAKFERRFAFIEAQLALQGRTPEGASLEEMDALWNLVRAADKSPAHAASGAGGAGPRSSSDPTEPTSSTER
jgi:MazG family protein